ncbi:MAG: hypothetical protein Q9227_004594 [Pyrenula ochraceoflavens]
MSAEAHIAGSAPDNERPPAPGSDIHSSDEEDDDSSTEPTIDVALNYHGKPLNLTVPQSFTLASLQSTISDLLQIPPSQQKLLISPKPGLIKPPFPETPIQSHLAPKTKITLIGTTTAELSTLNATLSHSHRLTHRPKTSTTKPTKYRDSQRIRDESTYTFHRLLPLDYLPNPPASLRFLQRLASDPGIKAAMRKHKFSVPLLTEMDPAAHTTHEGRTLGLNRNRGEVIELRLRTDAGDGYRDYKVIRKTLCHELAHCVFGPHDSDFWNLTRQIEGEVERGDWKNGGKSVGAEEFYNPGDSIGEGEIDGGGWTGGEFVLGREEGGRGDEGLSRREILARAAMERAERAKRMGESAEGGGQQGAEENGQR